MKQVAVLIPARLGSTRLPEKCLMKLDGVTIVRRVWQAAVASGAGRVIVACDHERIAREIQDAGGEAILTDTALASGTDRIAAVLPQVREDIIVNLQGDEPFIGPEIIKSAVEPFLADPDLEMGTIASPRAASRDEFNPSQVKVVTDRQGRALYFSRSLIPYPRDSQQTTVLAHIGLYVYRRDFLQSYATWPMGTLENIEKLEQLRALERGVRIRVVTVDYDGFGIDTAEDLQRAKAKLGERS
ncbi:MAG: 3-deoxy-manno-octulosonate cytidylyltransferase [Candidatus Wallbacteria bacterium]|nr:3-deoxy-manno-octulosonate cytidylyltransferase [Candidatus Wallbacteria bacterium]